MTKYGLLVTVEKTTVAGDCEINTIVISFENEYLAARAYNCITEHTATGSLKYHVVKLF